MDFLQILFFLITDFHFSSSTCEYFHDESILAPVQEYPYIVRIIQKLSPENVTFICTGTIIGNLGDRDIVLTAGSCIYNFLEDPSSIKSIYMRSNLNGTKDYKLFNWRIHPNFNSTLEKKGEFDVALLFVECSLEVTSESDLSKYLLKIRPPLVDDNVTIKTIGWDESKYRRSDELRVTDNLVIIPPEQCQEEVAIGISNQTFCVANNHNTIKGLYYSNIGGPLFYFKNNQTVLIGITAYEPNRHFCGLHPAVIVNISLYEDFITDVFSIFHSEEKTSNDSEKTSALRSQLNLCHMKLSYKDVTPNDVTIYLYTRNNRANGIKLKVNSTSQLPSLFNPNRKNLFVIHGWTSSYKNKMCQVGKEVALNASDLNVFLVDWSGPASLLGSYIIPYIPSVQVAPKLGSFIGTFIKRLISDYKVPLDNITIIGHSLGAHIGGFVGAELSREKKKIKYIVGLDPAGPCFRHVDHSKRLDRADAQFVQIIHTAADTWGIDLSIGSADYYVNGGKQQPDCSDDWARYLINFLYSLSVKRSSNVNYYVTTSPRNWNKLIDKYVGCSHQRSFTYLAESIQKECGFTAHRCDNWMKYKERLCVDMPESYMGRLNIDYKARGNYYLETNVQSPYSREACYAKLFSK
ncbi:hypothetical protein ILUMI_26295 [Ignelater luminosus]|uniref:Peptidase S1 domain-containing protein n=1 Tax=Ignelater luminosus TaxID=2038154 RepID=A0A8K0CA08_IGNLU|nr:hypothetical protein ILUMI_26295 [Ignelater luminosus]